jgi:hypothetical protein
LFILRIKAAICFRHSRLRLRTQREHISSSKRQLNKLQLLPQSATEQLLSPPKPAVQFRLDLDTERFHLCNLPAKLELPYRRLQISERQDLLYRWRLLAARRGGNLLLLAFQILQDVHQL